MTTPSDLLVAAADRIRDLAALAIAPPWSQSGRSVMDGPDEDHEVALTPTTTTARWIALMSPAVAPALEALLRVAAVEEATPPPLPYGSASLNSLMIAARELARQVLGEGSHG